MDHVFEHRGTTFIWQHTKAVANERKHDVTFAEATTVFDDPLFVVQDASRNEEERHAVTGFSATGRLLTVVHTEVDSEYIRIISARHASAAEEGLYDQ